LGLCCKPGGFGATYIDRWEVVGVKHVVLSALFLGQFHHALQYSAEEVQLLEPRSFRQLMIAFVFVEAFLIKGRYLHGSITISNFKNLDFD
jgi:hypothetical protein